MEKEFNLSDKIFNGYPLQDAPVIDIVDVKEFIRLLKDDYIIELGKCNDNSDSCPICTTLKYCLGAIEVYAGEKLSK